MAAGLIAFGLTFSGAAVAQSHEITVTVTEFKALDRADELSDGDFFARITIDGKSVSSAVLTGNKEYRPDWVLTLPVKSGTHNVRLELVDKDLTVDDPIDINRVEKKRALDFSVNTRTCKVSGFSEGYSCGSKITRVGTETKKAEITFVVKAN